LRASHRRIALAAACLLFAGNKHRYVDSLFTIIDIFRAPLVEARTSGGDTPQSSSGRRASISRRASIGSAGGGGLTGAVAAAQNSRVPSLDRSTLEKIFSNIEQVGPSMRACDDSGLQWGVLQRVSTTGLSARLPGRLPWSFPSLGVCCALGR
jgi:hypothetical protein